MTEIKLKQNIKLILKKIPTSNGVYFFLDKNGRPLYIGKAVNLRNRIKQYFTVPEKLRPGAGKTYSPFLSHLLEEAEKINFEITDSEIEALILESQYIKKYQPKYNQKLRDDKQYFYVISTKEKFPKIYLTHQPHKFKHRNINMSFIGPFTDGSILKSTLKFLRRVFLYCTCKQKHNNFCLNYHIGKCLGICCLKQQSRKLQIPNSKFQKILNDYKKNIKAIKEILTGKREALIKKLKKELMKLAKREEFEKAIDLRNKIKKLERVFENAQILQRTKHHDTTYYHSVEKTRLKLRTVLNLPRVPKRIEGYDVSNIQGTNATGSMVVFTNGQTDKNEYRKFKIRTKTTPDDIAMLKEILIRRFNHPEWNYPDLILIDGGKAQINVAINILKSLNLGIPIISLAKGKVEVFSSNKKEPIPMAQLPTEVRNLITHIDAEAHRFAIGYYRKLHRKRLTPKFTP